MHNMNQNKYEFNLLNDEAATEDFFTDKTHEKIADTLCKIISNESSNGVTIGLEGPWGSGKSTVISILKEKLNKDKVKYFYFDAWAHEGDPLRRIFLEMLIKQLDEKGEMEDIEKEISNRKRNTTLKTSKTATTLGKILSISALLVPFGAALLSTVDFSTVTFKNTGNINYTFLLTFIPGLIFSLAPIVVILNHLRKVGRPKNNPKEWIFLEGETNSELTQEISEDDERSSIEFEKYFNKIITKVLQDGGKSTRLLIIVDNLDRIDPKDSLKIWSTLQTFLQQRNPIDSDSDLYNKVWIIVPYDQEGLAKLWKIEIKNNVDEDDDDFEQVDVAKSFFEKNFQLRLDVPKPILSDWEDFTKTKIDEALKIWPDEEKEDILSVIVNTRKSLADIPTPRQIKTFINQVGLMRMHASEEIPTISVAYYVIFKYINNSKNVDTLRKEILKGKLPRGNDTHFLPENCDMHLAGLIFGVNPTKGQQLLLEPVIENALKFNKIEELTEIVDEHNEGFWSVFRFHITRITEGKILLPYSKSIYETLWGEYRHKCQIFIKRLNTFDFSFPTESNVDYYVTSIKMLIDAGFDIERKWGSIIKDLASKIGEEKFDMPTNIDLFSKLIDSFGNKRLKKYTFKEQDIARWQQWATESFKKKVNTYKWISPSPSIVNDLSEQIQPGQPISDTIFKTLEYSLKAGIKEWTPFVSACNVHISWNNGNPSGNNHSGEVLKYLLPLSLIDGSVTNSIQKLLKTGPFFNFVHHQQAKQSVLYSAIMTAFYYKNELHSFVIPPIANSENGIKLIRDFWLTKNDANAQIVWTILAEFKMYTIIWDQAENPENKLISDLITIGIKNDPSNICREHGRLIELHNALEIVDSDEFNEDIVKCFMDYSKILDKIKKTEEIDVIAYSKELHFIIDMLEDISDVKIHIIQRLIDISANEWVQAFNEDSYLLSLVVSVKNKDKRFSLENEYFNGIYNYAERWLLGQLEADEWIISTWVNLIKILKVSFQTHFKEKITDILWNKLDSLNFDAFDCNKDYFLITNSIRNNIQVLQKYLEDSFDNEKVLEKLKLLDLILVRDKKNHFKPDSHFTDFISAPLNTYYQSLSDDEASEMIIRIADRFKVSLKEKEDLVEEDINS